MKSLYFLLVCCLILTACSSNRETDSNTQQAHKYTPTLDVSVEVSGRSAIATITTDMTISEDHFGKARKAGEGHIHLYLDDGEKETAVMGTKEYTDLTPGSHKLRVSLHNNDHTPYDVTQSVAFEIK
jgi:hypothetical protein